MATENVYRVGERGVYEYSFTYADLSVADGVKSIALSGFPSDKVYRVTDVLIRKTADFVHVTAHDLYLSVWLNKSGSERQTTLMLPRKVSDGNASVDYNVEYEQAGQEVIVHGGIQDSGAASSGKSTWAEVFGFEPGNGGLSGFFVKEAMYLTDWGVMLTIGSALAGSGTLTITPQSCAANTLPTIPNHGALSPSIANFKTGSQFRTVPSIAFTNASTLHQTQNNMLVPVPADTRLTVTASLNTDLTPVNMAVQFWMRLIPQDSPGWVLRNRAGWVGNVQGQGPITLNLEAYLEDGDTKNLNALTAGAARLLVFYEEVI